MVCSVRRSVVAGASYIYLLAPDLRQALGRALRHGRAMLKAAIRMHLTRVFALRFPPGPTRDAWLPALVPDQAYLRASMAARCTPEPAT